MTLRFLSGLITLTLAAALAGCDSDAPPLYPDTGGSVDRGVDKKVEPSCPLSLTAVTQTTVNMQVGNTADVAVRLQNCRGEAPSPVVVVSFTITGNAQGSVLSSPSATTDDVGVARVTLAAGQQAATFQVQASYEALAPVVFQINVSAKPLGAIAVQMSYAGTQTLSGLQVLLYANQSCTGFDPFNPPAGQQTATPTSLNDQPVFSNLLEASYTVLVTAKQGTEVAAWGCTSGVAVVSGKTTTAAVTIVDLPIVFNGVYLLDNKFDLTGALPPSVGATMKLLTETGDDHDLTNEMDVHGTGQYGLDPAAFLLDFVYRQICRWECKTGEDFNGCSQVNHPQGDLEQLYKKNFMSWNGAQPYFMGLCSALDFSLGGGSYVYTWLNQQVQDQITTLVPTAIQNMAQIISDVASAFTKLSIKSRLTLAKVGLHGQPGNFTHVLETMVITVHNLSGSPVVKEVKLVDAGLTNLSYSGSTSTQKDVLMIPKHSFQLSFGKLLQYIYLSVILPTLGYTSSYQMFKSWVDCNAVGGWLAQQMGLFGAPFFAGLCDTGLQTAGTFLENTIQSSTTAATQIELTQGTCSAGTPLGPNREAITLVNGAWTGVITEGTFTAPLTGTFTGQRQ